jgi:malate dehydrogenase (oxaloacetate-decarboxylating)
MERAPSDSYSLTLRVKLSSRAGTLGEVATAIGKAGGDIGAIDIVSVGRDHIIRDITVNTLAATGNLLKCNGQRIRCPFFCLDETHSKA